MKEIFEYNPNGVCSSKMIFEIENDVIIGLRIIGGCPGNLQGISKLVVGMNIDDIISRLRNIKCGMKKTSCPDQLARGLEEYKRKRND